MIGLLIGRFQPFHLGHLYLIRSALKKMDKLIIAIGSVNLHDSDNFIDYQARKAMLEKVFKEEGLKSKIQKVIAINDQSDEDWLIETKKKAGKFDVVIGNNEWTNGIFERAKFPVLRFPYYKRYLYEGLKIRKLMQRSKKWEDRVPSYLISQIKELIRTHEFSFQHAVLGGTFDHFHKGHQTLIKQALTQSVRLTIGITDPKFSFHKEFSLTIESFDDRLQSLKRFITSQNSLKPVQILPIKDIYGTTLTDASFDAIFVTQETLKNAKRINEKRQKRKMIALTIIKVPYEKGSDNKIITSQRIRAGEIDREGDNYLEKLNTRPIWQLPQSFRKKLRLPLGKVVKSTREVIDFLRKSSPAMTIAVGDIIASSLMKNNYHPNLSVIDFRSRREQLKDRYLIQYISFGRKNDPGTINRHAVNELYFKMNRFLKTKQSQVIVIDGEEDLLTLPAVLLSPLGTVVLYGQYDKGVILVEVTEEKKAHVRKLLQSFE